MTGSINGKPFGLAYSESRFNQLKSLQRVAAETEDMQELTDALDHATKLIQPDWNEMVSHKSPFLQVNAEKGTYHLFNPDNGIVSPIPIPGILVTKIEESITRGDDITPIVKAWTRFLRNPNLNLEKARRFAWYVTQLYVNEDVRKEQLELGVSDEVARQRATTLQVPITMEGLLQTLKVSTEIHDRFIKDPEAEGGVRKYDPRDYEVDEFTGLKTYKELGFVEDRVFQPAVQGTNGDAFECINILTGVGKLGHIIRVGHAHVLPDWKMVNCNDFTSCVPGLHIGNYDYIKGYQGSGTVTHEVFADPMDIGAIVADNSGAIRVRRYFVHKSFAGVNKNVYNSSRVARITDQEYHAMVAKAVEDTKKQFADKLKEIEAAVGSDYGKAPITTTAAPAGQPGTTTKSKGKGKADDAGEEQG